METETRTQLGFTAFLFLVLLSAFLWAAFSDWRFYSALMPMVFSGFGTLLTGVVLVRDFRRARIDQVWTAAQVAPDAEDRVTDMMPTMLRFFVWLGLFYGGVLLIGFLPTIPLAIISYMRVIGGMRWKTSLLTAAIVVAILYVIYDELIHVAWYQPVFLNFY